MRFLKGKACKLIFSFLVILMTLYGGNVGAYYGLGGITGSGYYGLGGWGDLYGLYGGLYGGMYGGMYGLYGGMYGSSLYGGLYGLGMYGSSLYGGLYGLYGGLYGGSLYGGMYDLGGLYGLYGGLYGNLYGGLYGLGGLYGGIYGRYGFSEGSEELARQSQVLFLPGVSTLLPTTTTTSAVPAVPALPNPTGTWSGTWLSYITLKGGIASFVLAYNPLTLTVSGTAGLLLNKLIPIPINVAGLNSATGFTLSGSYLDPIKLVIYYADYDCTLVSPTFLTGTYLIHDALYLQTDTGNFNLSLVPVV